MAPTSPGYFSAAVGSMLLLAVVWAGAVRAAGEDFRVENRVFFGNDKEPASRSTTIFHDGAVFDYLDQPAEVVVLEPDAGRFVLLDLTRRVRAELGTEQLTAFAERVRQSAAANNNPFLKFLAAPKFDEQLDEKARQLTLGSKWMTYRLVLADAPSRAVAEQYREFADCSARLNTMLHPGSKPPSARLLVNAALAKHGAIARQVHFTLAPKRAFPSKRVTIRSEHELVCRLEQADLDRVAQTREFTRIFPAVGFEQYRKRR